MSLKEKTRRESLTPEQLAAEERADKARLEMVQKKKIKVLMELQSQIWGESDPPAGWDDEYWWKFDNYRRIFWPLPANQIAKSLANARGVDEIAVSEMYYYCALNGDLDPGDKLMSDMTKIPLRGQKVKTLVPKGQIPAGTCGLFIEHQFSPAVRGRKVRIRFGTDDHSDDHIEGAVEEMYHSSVKNGFEIEVARAATWEVWQVPASYHASATEKRQIAEVFRKYDVDGNGFMDADELEAIITQFMPFLGVENVHMIMEAADTDVDGQVSYEEFLEWVFTSGDAKKAMTGKEAKKVALQQAHESGAKVKALFSTQEDPETANSSAWFWCTVASIDAETEIYTVNWVDGLQQNQLQSLERIILPEV